MTTPLYDQLPAHLAADPFLGGFMSIFDAVHETVREHADQVDYLIDPALAPLPLLPWLGGWLGVRVEPSLDTVHQRRIVAEAARLFGMRGTRRGLSGLLEAMTGGEVSVDDEGGVFARGEASRNNKHVAVRLETSGAYSAEHLHQFVELELPADVTYELWIDGSRVQATRPRYGVDYPVGVGVLSGHDADLRRRMRRRSDRG